MFECKYRQKKAGATQSSPRMAASGHRKDEIRQWSSGISGQSGLGGGGDLKHMRKRRKLSLTLRLRDDLMTLLGGTYVFEKVLRACRGATVNGCNHDA